ncbi:MULTISPECIES: 2-iminoacetate synthase ThiH [unclassified Fusibacter]|uniref:2-iminoacetate synthase ThiH n=1 Tax=unclassified Fusibacter TaxID=2624464 RepID=UPI00101029A0|nr:MULTISPECIES: 2-iminoacetate synthase ThiH [unclassified Fusibacter]MCK8059931.1 2-iminoacetate synthase ThiH [Fusibacter sp. A2]NPE22073.1 2-iminoacetate synthase ThiH [Fusibacter sp. A1]RXV60852.1 2-iminoacetate synthase ThiH [Fusibacter sp. A1]
MSLIKLLRSLDTELLLEKSERFGEKHVKDALDIDFASFEHFLSLISTEASKHLEKLAVKASGISARQFGKTIGLYTPLYLGNFCENQCVYCGFNSESSTVRNKLDQEEIQKELDAIYGTGLREVLLLTGESNKHTPVDYIEKAVAMAAVKFKSIGIEIYPLDESGYERLISAGVNSLTIYQETYDEAVYDRLHLKGPKKDYEYRLNAPERAAKAGMAQIGIGALFGLSDPKSDAIKLYHHLRYLEKRYPQVELSISLPRLKPISGDLEFGATTVSDKLFVQLLLAFRICFPRLGINLSTRESQELREHLLALGITKMSAGVKTTVGGHSDKAASDVQFDIDDKRSVEEIMDMLKTKGIQHVLSDWVRR